MTPGWAQAGATAGPPRFVVIGFTADGDVRVEQGLRRLADAGGGMYVTAPDAAALVQALSAAVGATPIGAGGVADGAGSSDGWVLPGLLAANLCLGVVAMLVWRYRRSITLKQRRKAR